MRKNLDAMTIGLALFSLFFGAGNLIFPPFLGMVSGDKWFLGFVIYFIFDIGLALIAMLAISLNDNKLDNVVGKIGVKPAKIIGVVLMICIGPAIVIPRTAATTYEMLSNSGMISGQGMLIFTILYFAIVILLTIRPTKVIDIIGNFLTPVLFIGLAVLIIYGILNPIGDISHATMVDSVVKEGVTTGYQTMDVFGGLIFAGIIISTIVSKGYREKKEQRQITFRASMLASLLLLFVYGGLTYLGATVSTKFGLQVDRTGLLIAITNGLLGKFGAIALSAIVSIACLTTAIGLTSASATYFSKLTSGKISYKVLVLCITGASITLANLGLNSIINIAGPILNLIYPVVLTMIVLSLIPKHNNTFVNYGSVLTVILVSVTVMFNRFGFGFNFINKLPLMEIELFWILPALIGGAIGGIIGEFYRLNKEKLMRRKSSSRPVKVN